MNDRQTKGPFLVHPLVGVGILVLVLLLVLAMAIQVPTLGAKNTVLDFDAFYIAGQLANEGKIVTAYDRATMQAIQSALALQELCMPWTYPPQFNLIVMVLAWMPRGISYALFMMATFVPFVLVLRRIAGPFLADVLFLGLPALLINAAVGQNGFLTGALMGLFAMGWMANRSWAGFPLGLMVIKPHLALGAGLLALVSGRWRVALGSLALVAVTSALATLILGPQVWQAFLQSTASAGEGLKGGLYPLFRMTSIFAFLNTMGVPASVAILVQGFMALASLGTVVVASRMGWSAHRVLGVTLIATLGVSPYNYDYDMPILMIALALLMPDLSVVLGVWGRRGLFFFAWLCAGWGQFAALSVGNHASGTMGVDIAVSLGPLGYLALLVLIWRSLLRSPSATPSSALATA